MSSNLALPDSLIQDDSYNGFTSGRPFLKWAGGKAQLIPELKKRVPDKYKKYFEPFLGGGALFFNLGIKSGFISDINPELINTYVVVRDELEELINDLRQHYYEEEYYYQIRELDRSANYNKLSKVKRASRLIFLNKTCFNGLYRVNSKGKFNVPFGDYTNPKILDEKNLRACNQALKGMEIRCEDYLRIEDRVAKDDFVYFDPPYAPLSTTSKFTSYTNNSFGVSDQIALCQLCQRLNKKGVLFMLSNSSAPLVLDLYKGFYLEFVTASRAINSKADKRGKINEVIVTNY